jgi:hypothetical protein
MLAVFAPGCIRDANPVMTNYERTPAGRLQGKLIVQWLEPNQFLFLPDSAQPLTFIRSNGDTIQPGRMLTDGGSIPRPLWILRSYSPWGYAPAFVVHDWLFYTKYCKIPGYDRYDHHVAASVMAEVMKTMMQSGKVAVDKPTLLSMYLAVDSPVAESQWNTGQCQPPANGLTTKPPIQTFVLSFP